MNLIDSNLKDLEELYLSLENRLEKQYQDLIARRFPDPAEEAEAARVGGQILAAETRITQLVRATHANAWQPLAGCNADTNRAATLHSRVHHLLEIIERNAAQCRQLQREAQNALQELQRGGQFLQSVRGYRENQPKFLDTHR
jgi:hypothetical protein